MPARTIGDEYFRFDERRHAMIGRNSGETYRLGDPVVVKLIEAAPVAGALRFELISSGRFDRPRRAGYQDRAHRRDEHPQPRKHKGKRKAS